MSGTSLDGIDGVLARFDQGRIEIVKNHSIDYPDELRVLWQSLFTPGQDEFHKCRIAGHQRANIAAALVNKLQDTIAPNSIMAIADHGQTVRHSPQSDPPYSMQIHDAPRLVALTQLSCIVDFRSQDIAKGGQGAPLTPAFHQRFFCHQNAPRVIVNIGGIANISLVVPGDKQAQLGFDTGPGNTLMDLWCHRHTAKDFDDQGGWARSGRCDQGLLTYLLKDDYFSKLPPKSTGREVFHLPWLEMKLKNYNRSIQAADVQATLCALSAKSIVLGIEQACTQSKILLKNLEGIYICGGGASNLYLMQLLKEFTNMTVKTTDTLGVPTKLVEAAAFAWLGKRAMEQKPTLLSRATGTRQANIYGAVYACVQT